MSDSEVPTAHVLVVDDSPTMRRMVISSLKGLGNAKFSEAGSGLEEPAVRHVVGSPDRFRGKRVLELGFCTGKMSCYFGLLGATVLGLDMSYSQPGSANALARDLNLSERVSFRSYDGNLAGLEGAQWDFVFTKSVLVLLPIEQAAPALRRLLKPGGQYLACENCVLPLGLNRLRKHQVGVDQKTLNALQKYFSTVESKRHYGLVSSIVATY